METLIIKVDETDATVQYKPNWWESLWGTKGYIEQFYRSKTEHWPPSNQRCWISYQTGIPLQLRSQLHTAFTNLRRIYLKTGKAPF